MSGRTAVRPEAGVSHEGLGFDKSIVRMAISLEGSEGWERRFRCKRRRPAGIRFSNSMDFMSFSSLRQLMGPGDQLGDLFVPTGHREISLDDRQHPKLKVMKMSATRVPG